MVDRPWGTESISVLIADDHALVRRGIRLLLEAQPDIDVVAEAEDCVGTIEQVAAHQPQVLLLDVTMPGGNGIQILGRVREASPDTRILILTMHDDTAYLRSALAAGVDGYMVKTGADSELVSAIRAVHRGRSYIDVSVADSTLQDMLHTQDRMRRVARPNLDQLSERERQVLAFVAYGYTHKEIAERIGVSTKSVETYRARVGDKLGLRTRAELVRYALDHGMMGPDRAPMAR